MAISCQRPRLKVRVPADDERCPSGLGGLEHPIVFGVVRDDTDTLDRFDDLTDAHDLGVCSPQVGVLPNGLLREDPTELGQQRG
jgi:hypothetical protein